MNLKISKHRLARGGVRIGTLAPVVVPAAQKLLENAQGLNEHLEYKHKDEVQKGLKTASRVLSRVSNLIKWL